jgi:hypothetical protein
MLQEHFWQRRLSLKSFGWTTFSKIMELRICVSSICSKILIKLIVITYMIELGWPLYVGQNFAIFVVELEW